MNTIDRTVTAERTGEILDRIKQVFARKGFEGASMQELARAAQMSVGNFYRYFPSKSAIVTALVERDLLDLQRDFDAARQADDKVAAYMALASGHMRCTTGEEAALWAEIDAAAYRNPEIAAIRERLYEAVRCNILTAMKAAGGREHEPADDDMRVRAELAMLLVQGLAKRRGFADAYGATETCEGLSAYAMRVIGDLIFAPRD